MSVINATRPTTDFIADEFEELNELDLEPELPRGFEFVDGQLEELNVS